MRSCSVLVIFVLMAWLRPGPGALACPSEPTDSWVYPYLYELRLRAPGGPIFVSTGPYGRLATAGWLQSVDGSEVSARSTWLYDMLGTEFEAESRVLEARSGWTGDLRLVTHAGTEERTLGEVSGRFAYYSSFGLCMWTSFRGSANAPGLHKMQTRVWQDRGRASVDYAGISLKRSGFFISLARDEVSWGAERRTGLLFSGTAPVFDMLAVGYRARRVGFTSFHTRLRRGGDEYPDNVGRFVSAHRLEVLPTDRLSISLSEAVIYGGPYRTLEPVYLNPLTIFYANQWNSQWNDNILIAGDFSLLFPQHAEIRGEVMIDDFQYDFGTEPHEFGIGLHVTAVNPFRPSNSLVGASYYRVSNQTYGHFIAWNRFIHEGQVMGYPEGPDGDRLALWLTLASPETMVWKVDYGIQRRGQGRAWDVQEETGPRVDFPSGTVETRQVVGLGLDWRPSHAWLLCARTGYRHTHNADNLEGLDESGWDAALNVQFCVKLNTWLDD